MAMPYLIWRADWNTASLAHQENVDAGSTRIGRRLNVLSRAIRQQRSEFTLALQDSD